MTTEAKTFTVQGMTCEHCVRSVREEVSAVPGVRSADVRLADGQLTVTGDVGHAAVVAAVEAAGYEIAS